MKEFRTMHLIKQFLLIFLLHNIRLTVGEPVVHLPNGAIQGSTLYSINGNLFYSFQKIPYAAPPIGELRFKPPVPPENWDGILKATKLDVICYQSTLGLVPKSEDCLYLNVYTPQLPDEGPDNKLLPVMFYLHGGGFTIGNALIDGWGPEFLIEKEVVIVTINYRLGPFGFLSTQDEILPGNYGLKDQQFAIKWTRDNIRLFGGDPGRITVFGQSAGSAAVTYQLLNADSEGLFHGAICQSGTFLSPWSYQRNAREIAFTVASYLNETFITNRDSTILRDFLLTLPTEDIEAASQNYINTESVDNLQISQGYYWAPVVEADHSSAFFTEKMYEKLKTGDFVKVPILMGITSEENLFDAMVKISFILKDALAQYDANLDWLVPKDMQIPTKEQRIEMGKLIRNMYTGGDALAENLGSGVRFLSDNSFTRSVIKFAEIYSTFANVYFYQFSYDGLMGASSTYYEGAERVAHSEDTKYIWRMTDIFYDNSNLDKFPESDLITQQRLLTIWSNFAKTLNPTPEPSAILQNLTWPLVTAEGFPYVDIGESLLIKNKPKSDTYSKWVELYNALGDNQFDTY